METISPHIPLHGTAPLSTPCPTPDRTVPEHIVPVPSTVSPGFRCVIGADPPDWPKQRPKTIPEWHKVIADYNKTAADQSIAIRNQLQVDCKDIRVNDVLCHLLTPQGVPSGHEKRLLVHTHGGAYVFAAGEAGLAEAALVAFFSQSPVLSVDYRMPPEYPFPAAVDDVVAVWRKMLETHDRANSAMFGSSAGGGLTMAATLQLKQLGLPLPAALFLGSPWANIEKKADSLFANEKTDNLLYFYDGLLGDAAKLYADRHSLNEPLLSPLEGDLSGFPPSIIISGTRDLFLSLAALTHRKLRRSGVDAQLHVFEAASHIEYLAIPTPECEDAMSEVAQFFERHLAQ